MAIIRSRLVASVPKLFTGKKRRSFSGAISATSKCTIFAGKLDDVSCFQYQGLESSRRSLNTSSTEDDFSELGPPMAESAGTQLKLATEKRDSFMKTDLSGKASVNRSFNPEWRRSLVDVILGFDKTSQTSNLKLHNHSDVSKLDVKQKNYSKTESSCHKSIENVPAAVECCEVDSKVVTIRIRGIGKETTDPMIHSICKSIGALEGLSKSDKDAVDALFIIENDTDLQSILKRLNSTIIDDRHWSAYQLPRNSTSSSASMNEDVKSKFGLEINSCLIDLKRKLDSKKVDFEDLELLHLGIMHLEGLPSISNPPHPD